MCVPNWPDVCAQPGLRSSNQTERACLQALAELEAKRKEVELLRAQNADREEIRKAQSEQIATLKQIIRYLEEASKKGDAAASVDAQASAELQAQVKSFQDELQRVRGERDALRGSRNRWGLIGLVVGVLVGALASR